MTRRDFIATAGAAAASTVVGSGAAAAAATDQSGPAVKNGRINQTICQWCWGKVPFEELCQHAVRLGVRGIDLVGPDKFDTLKKYNLVGTMTPSHALTKGINNPAHHAECLQKLRDAIDATSAAGFPNVITFPGNRAGMSDEEGARHCVAALKQIVGHAEQKRVTICMELLNSKVDHKDYQADHTNWAVGIVKAVGSERFKLLYDIYHMQIMEGDIIATIRKNRDYIAHYHTAGVPGRHEIDDTQELNYPPIMRAIVETGYTGWVGQEFIAKRDPIASLEEAVRLCDV
jgi:hydroxypyruvate isomerase